MVEQAQEVLRAATIDRRLERVDFAQHGVGARGTGRDDATADLRRPVLDHETGVGEMV